MGKATKDGYASLLVTRPMTNDITTKQADAAKVWCELNYAIASHPKFADNPVVIVALANAKASEATFIAAAAEADGRSWDPHREPHVRQVSAAIESAHAALRAAIESASGSDHLPAHDEFSGARNVSPLHQAMRISGFDRLRRTAAAGAIGIWALSLIAADDASAAEDASRWDGDAHSAVRLIAGSAAGSMLRAGVEIRLKSGWHTYWRYPGDAGVPPRFDFTGSQNVKAVDVLWPAPQPIPEHDHDRIYRRRHSAPCGRAGE